MALEIYLDRNRGDLIEIFWKPLDNTFKSFRLYRDTIHSGAFATMIAEIANAVNPPESRLPGSIGIALSRTALSLAQTDPIFLILTSVTNAGVESAKASSPIRMIFPAGTIPATIAVSEKKQTFSLPFVSSSFAAVNAGMNEVFLAMQGQIIQIAAGQSFDMPFLSVQTMTAYCSAGETSTIQVAGAPVNI